jgi:transcriptional regulator NrdR family protein
MIRCPKCDGKSSVIDSRPTSTNVRRRRECGTCFTRWSTHEVLIGQDEAVDVVEGVIDLLTETRKAMRRVEESLVNGRHDPNEDAAR